MSDKEAIRGELDYIQAKIHIFSIYPFLSIKDIRKDITLWRHILSNRPGGYPSFARLLAEMNKVDLLDAAKQVEFSPGYPETENAVRRIHDLLKFPQRWKDHKRDREDDYGISFEKWRAYMLKKAQEAVPTGYTHEQAEIDHKKEMRAWKAYHKKRKSLKTLKERRELDASYD